MADDWPAQAAVCPATSWPTTGNRLPNEHLFSDWLPALGMCNQSSTFALIQHYRIRGVNQKSYKFDKTQTSNKPRPAPRTSSQRAGQLRWAEARIQIARMTLTIKLDRNWSSFQLANSAPPLSVTGSAIAPSARMDMMARPHVKQTLKQDL